MLLLLMFIAICAMIVTYIFQYVSYQRSRIADDVCGLMGLEKYLIEVFDSEYDASDHPYSKKKYLEAAQGLNSTFKQRLSNTLHEHHSRSDLSLKRKQLKQNSNIDVEDLFPNFLPEIRRVAHVLSEEIDMKFRKEISANESAESGKRRRRR